MKRSTVTTDRLATAVAGLAVLVLGAAGAAWQLGRLPVPPGSPLHVRNLPGTVGASWWPYALGVTAIVLIALGLWWLYGHRPGQSIGTTTLPNSSTDSRLTIDVDTAASAAAAALDQHSHVTSASGTSRVDRGQRVVEIDVKLTADPSALAAVTDAIPEIGKDLAAALDGVEFTSRFLLRAPREHGNSRRVSGLTPVASAVAAPRSD